MSPRNEWSCSNSVAKGEVCGWTGTTYLCCVLVQHQATLMCCLYRPLSGFMRKLMPAQVSMWKIDVRALAFVPAHTLRWYCDDVWIPLSEERKKNAKQEEEVLEPEIGNANANLILYPLITNLAPIWNSHDFCDSLGQPRKSRSLVRFSEKYISLKMSKLTFIEITISDFHRNQRHKPSNQIKK